MNLFCLCSNNQNMQSSKVPNNYHDISGKNVKSVSIDYYEFMVTYLIPSYISRDRRARGLGKHNYFTINRGVGKSLNPSQTLTSSSTPKTKNRSSPLLFFPLSPNVSLLYVLTLSFTPYKRRLGCWSLLGGDDCEMCSLLKID